MKRLLALGAVALFAFPLVAGEKEKAQKPASEAPAAAETSAPAASDSPLVAAAKRARRGTSKTIVITDATVKSSTGHLTTTDSIYNPSLPKTIEPSADVVANEARAKERAAEEKKALEAKAEETRRDKELARKARLAETAEEYEDGYDDGQDPAQVERDMATAAAAEKKPQR